MGLVLGYRRPNITACCNATGIDPRILGLKVKLGIQLGVEFSVGELRLLAPRLLRLVLVCHCRSAPTLPDRLDHGFGLLQVELAPTQDELAEVISLFLGEQLHCGSEWRWFGVSRIHVVYGARAGVSCQGNYAGHLCAR